MDEQPCSLCGGDGYLPESTLTWLVYCACPVGVAVHDKDQNKKATKAEWIILNERDMLFGEFVSKDDANVRCRELNEGRGVYRVVPAPGKHPEFYRGEG